MQRKNARQATGELSAKSTIHKKSHTALEPTSVQKCAVQIPRKSFRFKGKHFGSSGATVPDRSNEGLKKTARSTSDAISLEPILTACSADVPKEQPQQCAQCVRFHQRQFPCPHL